MTSRGLTFLLIAACAFAGAPAYAKKQAPAKTVSEREYYKNPAGTLGYKENETFRVAPNLVAPVNFWKRIYTEHTTKQSVIHDAKYLNVVYTVLDFTDLYTSKQYTDGQIRHIREEQTEQVKNYYRKILRDLERVDSEDLTLSSLTPEERLVYRQFDGINEAYRFEKAQGRVRAQVGQRDEFIRGIVDSGGYIAAMEEIFRSYKLPVQLIRLTFVESMFNTKAYSKAHASGIWQFIPSTGRLYLRIDTTVDERNDPLLATHASAKLMMTNYESLQSWPLALTAYNHGRSGMKRAVEKTGETDLGHIIGNYQSNSFGFASRNFYAQFLAALDVERNYQKYFGPLVRLAPVEFEVVRLPDHISLARLSEYTHIPEDELIDLNPALAERVMNSITYVPTNYDLKIPKGAKREFLVAYANIPREYRKELKQAPKWHRVREGENISQIARTYRVSTGHLLKTNNLSGANKIYVGQLLKIPSSSPVYVAEEKVVKPPKAINVARAPTAVVKYPEVKVKPLKDEEIEEMAPASTPAPVTVEQAVMQALEKPTPLPSAQAAAPPTPAPATLFAAADQNEPAKTFTLDHAQSLDPKTVDWKFRYEPRNPQASSDAPFAGETVVLDGETPGHFAEWCRISTPQFRRLNHLKFSQSITQGKKIKLECLSTQNEFHTERLAFHRQLQEEYMKECSSFSFEKHTMKRSETLWDLANTQYRTPLWLIQKANPDKDLTEGVSSGDTLKIPLCLKNESAQAPPEKAAAGKSLPAAQ